MTLPKSGDKYRLKPLLGAKAVPRRYKSQAPNTRVYHGSSSVRRNQQGDGYEVINSAGVVIASGFDTEDEALRFNDSQ